jgi:inorganic triphosphatase YgiF
MPQPQIDADLEIESKFACQRASDLDLAAEAFRSISREIRKTNRYTSALHYYDTAALDLRGQGVILRTLDANPPHYDSRVQIKSAQQGTGGMMQRTEHNLPVSGNGLKLDDLKGHAALAFLKAAKGRAYQHWFTTLTDRREIRAMFAINGKDVMIECDFDV